MSKHKCSLGEVQESLSKLRVQLWGTAGHLNNAGLSETDAFHQLNATGEMLNRLLKQLSSLPIPSEVFNDVGTIMSTEVRHTPNDGA